MDTDKEFMFDARKARQVEYPTRLPTEVVDRAGLRWYRRIGPAGNDIGLMDQTFHGNEGAPDFYVLPGETTATVGTFTMGLATQLVAPALTMKAIKRRAPELHPAYPSSTACPAKSKSCVGVDLDNTVPAGSTYSIKLNPGYQPGYEGSDKFHGPRLGER